MTIAGTIYQHLWTDDSPEFRAALSRAILSREVAGPGIQVSNVGGWHSAPNLHTWDDPAVMGLFERIQADASAVGADGLRLQAWANVMRAGAYQIAHRHGEAVWSGIYYVDAAGSCGGEIKFAHGQEAWTIVPRTGLMLIFPGDLLHSVEPYGGAGTRISVAFNLF